jgi:CspA family cold shock protein
MARGVVKFWKSEKGWGAISCPELPAGEDAWAHFSMLDIEGYRELRAGQAVDFEYERAQQDTFSYRATWVRPVPD